MTQCISTTRVKAGPGVSASKGTVRWRPAKSLWVSGMTIAGVGGAFFTFSWDALAVFVIATSITICAGHSVGMHRLLIHRSFKAPRWLEYLLVWLGVLVGMAGPFGMIKAHDLRDYAHRRPAGHWYVAGVCVQGFNVPYAGLITFGESWHNNHHAFPSSARLGLEPGQADPGWWFIQGLRVLGLAWNIQTPGTLAPRQELRRLHDGQAIAAHLARA